MPVNSRPPPPQACELVVHTPEQIELLRAAPAGAVFKILAQTRYRMNRLGFKGQAFDAAHAALGALPAVQSPVNLFHPPVFGG